MPTNLLKAFNCSPRDCIIANLKCLRAITTFIKAQALLLTSKSNIKKQQLISFQFYAIRRSSDASFPIRRSRKIKWIFQDMWRCLPCKVNNTSSSNYYSWILDQSAKIYSEEFFQKDASAKINQRNLSRKIIFHFEFSNILILHDSTSKCCFCYFEKKNIKSKQLAFRKNSWNLLR